MLVSRTIEDVWASFIIGDDRPNVIGVVSSGGAAYGRGGNDTLATYQDGQATLKGQRGDDLLNPLGDDNAVDGGSGSDFLSYCGPYGESSGQTTIDLDAGTATNKVRGSSAGVNTLSSIENAHSCDGNDTLLGTPGSNILLGGENADIIDGRGGDDLLAGDRAPRVVRLTWGDWLRDHFAKGRDVLTGGTGDDRLWGNAGGDSLDGGSGTNSNNGGDGLDKCVNPTSTEGAVNCES